MAGCNLIGIKLTLNNRTITMFFNFAYKCRTFPGLHVPKIRHTAPPDPSSSMVIPGRNHCTKSFTFFSTTFLKNFSGILLRLQYRLFITTVSSIRTPPIPGIYTPGSTFLSYFFQYRMVSTDKNGDSWISSPHYVQVNGWNKTQNPSFFRYSRRFITSNK